MPGLGHEMSSGSIHLDISKDPQIRRSTDPERDPSQPIGRTHTHNQKHETAITDMEAEAGEEYEEEELVTCQNRLETTATILAVKFLLNSLPKHPHATAHSP